MYFKKRLLQHLEKYTWYYRFKYAKPIYTLIEAFRPKLKKNRIAEQHFFQTLLAERPKDALIFDIGASVGNTTAVFLQLGTRVLSVEPDAKNVLCLQARYAQNQQVTILEKALSNEIGQQDLYLQETGNTLHTLNPKWKNYLEGPQNDRWREPIRFSQTTTITTTTLARIIQEFGKPFFIKIDVEGHEAAVLQGLDQKIPFVSFEANLPEFLTETLQGIEHLCTLSDQVEFNYVLSEKLELENFVNAEAFKAILQVSTLRYMDVICRMY